MLHLSKIKKIKDSDSCFRISVLFMFLLIINDFINKPGTRRNRNQKFFVVSIQN